MQAASQAASQALTGEKPHDPLLPAPCPPPPGHEQEEASRTPLCPAGQPHAGRGPPPAAGSSRAPPAAGTHRRGDPAQHRTLLPRLPPPCARTTKVVQGPCHRCNSAEVPAVAVPSHGCGPAAALRAGLCLWGTQGCCLPLSCRAGGVRAHVSCSTLVSARYWCMTATAGHSQVSSWRRETSCGDSA